MKIKELNSCKNGEMVNIREVAVNKELKTKRSRGELL